MPVDCRRSRSVLNRKGDKMSCHAKHEVPSPVRELLTAASRHIDAGRTKAALPIYEEAVALVPDNPDLQHTIGLVYLEMGQYDRAVAHIGRSVELNPSNDVAYRSMGDALVAADQIPLAIRAYQKSCHLNPDNVEALLHLGNLFHDMYMYERAEENFSQILAASPNHRQGLNNLAKLYHDMGRLENALALYDRCIDRYPQYADAQFNRAALLLAMGDFNQGWEAYEWRFGRDSAASVYPHHISTPRWQGEKFQNRRLLVHCEQGMGDVLQFLRYLPMVKALGGEVVLEVHEPLVPLLQSQSGVDAVIPFNAQSPPTISHDMHIPLLSLPRIFMQRTVVIPAELPYIRINRGDADKWKDCHKPGAVNIGLVWASSAVDPRRNLPIERCAAWFDDPGLHFISLQKGPALDQIDRLPPSTSHITVVGPELRNFLDTAHAMAGLDLVISVDTAALHLAGGMGLPLWVPLLFSADWRWPSDGKPSVWYPHAKIFRQNAPGDWDDVIGSIGAMLKSFQPLR